MHRLALRQGPADVITFHSRLTRRPGMIIRPCWLVIRYGHSAASLTAHQQTCARDQKFDPLPVRDSAKYSLISSIASPVFLIEGFAFRSNTSQSKQGRRSLWDRGTRPPIFGPEGYYHECRPHYLRSQVKWSCLSVDFIALSFTEKHILLYCW